MKNKFFYLSLLHFFNDGFLAAIVLFFPFIAKELAFNLAQVGALGTAIYLVPIVVALPTVLLTKKFGNFPVLLFALLLYSVGYLAMGVSLSFVSIIGALLLAGAGFGLFHPIGFASISKWSESHNIGKNLGNFTAMGDVGRVVISGGVTFFIVAFTWQKTALLYGAVGLFILIYLYLFHFRNKLAKTAEVLEDQDHNFKDLLKNKKFIFAFLCCTFDNLASSPIFLFLPFLLLSKHVDPKFLSSFASALLFGFMLGKMLLGRWVDKSGSAKVFVIAELVMAGLIFCLTLVNGTWLIITFSLLLGMATRGTVPAARSLVHDSVIQSGNFDRASSLVEIGNMTAAAVAPLLLGLVSKQFGINSAFWLAAGFAVLAVLPAFYFLNKKPSA